MTISTGILLIFNRGSTASNYLSRRKIFRTPPVPMLPTKIALRLKVDLDGTGCWSTMVEGGFTGAGIEKKIVVALFSVCEFLFVSVCAESGVVLEIFFCCTLWLSPLDTLPVELRAGGTRFFCFLRALIVLE
jgi:hypothetical protein